MYSVDDLSARFIEHTLGSISDEVSTAKVSLYTLEGDAYRISCIQPHNYTREHIKPF